MAYTSNSMTRIFFQVEKAEIIKMKLIENNHHNVIDKKMQQWKFRKPWTMFSASNKPGKEDSVHLCSIHSRQWKN